MTNETTERIGQEVVAERYVTVAMKRTVGIDWSAYWLPAEQVVSAGHTADRGDKLPEAVARFFFPGIEEPYRW